MFDPKKYIERFHHIGFVVADIDRALEFYTGKLGFTPYDRWSETVDEVQGGMGVAGSALELAQVTGYGCMLEFVRYTSAVGPAQPPEPNRVSVGHPAFLVSDLRTFVAGLREQGVTVCGEIVELPTSRWVHITDPDGVRIEFMEIFG